jgi:parallel beta-helix repeat protein
MGSVCGAEYVIDDSNYSNYFDDNGNIKDGSGINDGDTLKIGDIHGTPENPKLFIIDKKLKITSNDPNNQIIAGKFIFDDGSQGSTLSGIKLTYPGYYSGFGFGIISIYDTGNILLENNNVFYNAPYNSIGGWIVDLKDSSDITMKNNVFRRTGGSTGLHMTGSSNINLFNNYISSGNKTHQGGNVVDAEGKNYNIAGNTIVGSPSNICYGIKLNARNSVVNGNSISGSSVGIKIEALSKNIIVSNNDIFDIDAYLARDMSNRHDFFEAVGIDCDSQVASVTNNRITGMEKAGFVRDSGINTGAPIHYYAIRGIGFSREVDKFSNNNIIQPDTNENAYITDDATGNNLTLRDGFNTLRKNGNVLSGKLMPSSVDPTPGPTPTPPSPTPGTDPSPGSPSSDSGTGPSSSSDANSISTNGAVDASNSGEQSDASEEQGKAHEITNSPNPNSPNSDKDSPSATAILSLIVLIISLFTLGYMGNKKSKL